MAPERDAFVVAASSEPLLWSILDSLPGVGLMVLDRGLRVTAAGGAALADGGFTRHEVVGRSLESLVSADAFELYAPHLRAALDGRRTSLESRARDGRRIFISDFSALRAPAGEAVGVVMVSREVTAQRASEAARDEATTIFEAAFSQAPIGMAVVGLDGRWIRVNRMVCQLLGYDEEALLSLTFQELTHPDDIDLDLGLVRQLLAGEIERYSMDKRYITAEGAIVWTTLSVSLVRGAGGDPLHFLSQIQDISDRKELESELQTLADHDPLTDLWNRRRFDEALHEEILRCRRYGERAALLIIDLDGFKRVNDTYGHQAGDELLARIARGVRSRLRGSDCVARMGGDEFAIILPNTTLAQAEEFVPTLRQTVEEVTVAVAGGHCRVTASIGVAGITEETAGSRELLAVADAAMYRAKQAQATS